MYLIICRTLHHCIEAWILKYCSGLSLALLLPVSNYLKTVSCILSKTVSYFPTCEVVRLPKSSQDFPTQQTRPYAPRQANYGRYVNNIYYVRVNVLKNGKLATCKCKYVKISCHADMPIAPENNLNVCFNFVSI